MSLPYKAWDKAIDVAKEAKKIGKEDPRRIIHSVKLGLALTLVSVFYYFNPLYEGFEVNAIWAVLTVVVVFEFSVGATLGKGLNRMVATLVAGTLAIGTHRIATHSGHTGEPILVAIFVFIVAATVTFTRFFPALKARYDYGLTIFILTFSLVSVSGYRDSQVLKMAHMRVTTIIIGSCTSIIVSILICPVWIGEDLHKLVLGNIEKLGDFLEGFGSEYFEVSEDEPSNNDKSFLQNYKSVLTSKSKEETMINLAKWEPSHGGFRFCHPWKQYLKIGSLTRECAYKIEALNNSLHSKIQTSTGIQKKFAESSAETVKLLLRNNSWEVAHLIDVVSVGAVALLLLEVLESIEKLVEAIDELASMAHFKTIDPNVSPEQPHLLHRGTVQPM
ncbi:conserved hypothetical protein [Ricinus communis]|uniref:Aluminum-activated malate transporter n=1 Tax=Ricinus communis TaxID=3988 RepID=B9RIZ3_RICCO|nr:conserved hypothetical protein [Ricinus communis]